MFLIRYLSYLILFTWISGIPQINFYNNCFRFIVPVRETSINRKVIFYCMNDSLIKYETTSKLTFANLFKNNITTQQLYLWSASIDLIEDYQLYTITNDLSLANKEFYNCTWPNFGSQCQYEFDFEHSHSLSFYEIIANFYYNHNYNAYRRDIYDQMDVLCYILIQCTRRSYQICLDWTDICDGKIDCLDNNIDEINCWQLKINECEENEYRCLNGQCIPQLFYEDDAYTPDCLDKSDEVFINEPSFGIEDITCMSLFSTSCVSTRQYISFVKLFSFKHNSLTDNCWLAFQCLFNTFGADQLSCDQFCSQTNICLTIVEDICPDIIRFSNFPFFLDEIYIAYQKIDISNVVYYENHSAILCYNHSYYNQYFIDIIGEKINNEECFFINKSLHIYENLHWHHEYHDILEIIYDEFIKYYSIENFSFNLCNHSHMYSCINSSKCISYYLLMNGKNDCFYNDDENLTIISNNNIFEKFKQTHIKCEISNRYIRQIQINDGTCDCGYIDDNWCEDENLKRNLIAKDISFQTICDGYSELSPIYIDNYNETDETNCQQWECDNMYTHCNNLWNCPNGIDEIGCSTQLTFSCPLNNHFCVSLQTYELSCLSIDKINDGQIDCLGATDEPYLCRIEKHLAHYSYGFYCINESSGICIDIFHLCDKQNDCTNGDDETYCKTKERYLFFPGLYWLYKFTNFTDTETFFGEYMYFLKRKEQLIYFSLYRDNNLKIESTSILLKNEIKQQYQFPCHRGLPLRIRNSTTIVCLCPSHYYGNRCEYENDRISLSIQFRTLSDSWKTLFSIVILLIDNTNERIIHWFEQLSFLSIRDCRVKFNIHLFYFIQSKDLTKNYSIHIDFYEKFSLIYRGSIILSVPFLFLPVQRLAYIVTIPSIDQNNHRICSNIQCINGKCIKYFHNKQNHTFCQCYSGWSGKFCNIQYNCTCAFGSLCIGILANNQSICICPINKFGSQCLITYPQLNDNIRCLNGGKYILNEYDMVLNQSFTCICPRNFSGNRCEIADHELIFTFDKKIHFSPIIFIHFIEILKNNFPTRLTTFRSIPTAQDNITIYWSRPFHLIFIELQKKTYYIG